MKKTKKDTNKKLVLKTETLRQLADKQLSEVNGGAPTTTGTCSFYSCG